MSSTIVETSSRVADSELDLQTHGMRTDDWVWPDIEPNQWSTGEGETTSGGTGTPPSQEATRTTVQCIPRNVSAPVRKDHLTIRPPDTRVKLLQQWECVISRVHEDFVECEMHDLTNDSQPVEQADVYIDEFNHFDRALLQEGAVFYWSIGHETRKTGQVRRYSELRVRRMPRLSNLRKREISRKAEQLCELLQNKGK